MIAPKYKAQVDLLLTILPLVPKEESFVLKGGTAINLFVREMPRLSVDIDLTYTSFDRGTIQDTVQYMTYMNLKTGSSSHPGTDRYLG